MRILLVMPKSASGIWEDIALLEPLGLETIAAYLPDHDVRLLDLRLEPRLEVELASFRPRVVGFHCHTTEVGTVIALARRVKAADAEILTVVGGHHASLFPNEFLDASIDAVVIGDGEIAFRELVDAYGQGSDLAGIPGVAYAAGEGRTLIRNEKRPLLLDMDTVRLPDRDLIARYWEEYYYLADKPVAIVTASRGCPYHCTFCSVWRFNRGRYAAKGADRVVRELSESRAANVFFADDNFFHNPRSAGDVCEAIKSAGLQREYRVVTRSDIIVQHPELIEQWREIGLRDVQIAFEYSQDEPLARVHKRNSVKNNEDAAAILRANDVKITANFIVDPDFEEADFERLTEYINRMRIDTPLISILTPLPGTTLYEQMYNDLLTHNHALYDFLHAVVPTRLPRRRFYERFARLQKESWLGALRRDGNATRQIDPAVGSRVIAALRKLADHRTYLLAEEGDIRAG